MFTAIHIFPFVLLLSLTGWYRWRRARLPLPPGPKRYPVIGNLLDMPSQHQWAKYFEWSRKYNSDVIYMSVFGSPIIILNSYKAANELFSARSLLYSDRPRMTMINELLGWGSLMSHLPYGHAWRVRRRVFWQEFNPEHSPNHHSKQLWHSRDLLRRLLEQPERFLHHIDYVLAATIISTTYGLDSKPEHDPNIERAERALVQLKEAAISGNFLVDSLPVLKYIPSWMPGAGFKVYAKRVRSDTADMKETPYKQACSRLHEGKGEPSLLSRRLGRGGYSIDSHPDEEVIKDVAWVAYAGGAETSHLALSTFFAAMLLHPEVQSKGQKELDAHIGSRLPEFEDLPHLPYVRAIMLEVLRWQVVVPLGLAHRVTMDDEYMGYLIPKGSTIFVNIWALLRDEEYYPNPDIFDPERFLKDGEIDSKLLDPIQAAFGFGRRICPGRFFAMDSLLMSMASTLLCFDISKAKDTVGRDIEPDIRYIPGFTRHIVPFECTITPRSAEAVKLIRDSELT